MVSRFTWTDWARGTVLKHDEQIWQGEHKGYKRLTDPVSHKRTVMLLSQDRWLVIDHLDARQVHHYALHWLLNDFPYTQRENSVCLWPESAKYQIQMGLLEGKSTFSVVRGDPTSTRGWRSQYYGHKEPAISAMLETDQSQARFWTFFGFENDSIESMGSVMKIRFDDMESSINL